MIVTMIDNNPHFYLISAKYENIKTLFIQNAHRGKTSFGKEAIQKFRDSNQELRVDYMCVHGEAAGLTYKKFIEGESVCIGSIKNNQIAKVESVERGTIAVISHHRVKYAGLTTTSYKVVLHFLHEYAQTNGKRLKIICNTNSKGEREHFNDIMDGREFQFVDQPNRYGYTSYMATDKAEVVVGLVSTLTYESAARGNKTAFFYVIPILSLNQGIRYGYPEEVPDVGPYWTNFPDIKVFKNIIDHLFEISDEEWRKELENTEYPSQMGYDPGNSVLKGILSKELGSPPVG